MKMNCKLLKNYKYNTDLKIKNMVKVGLTGNFGSGHNLVAQKFEERKIPYFDADLIFKFLINYDESGIKKCKSKFGKEIYKFGLIDLKPFSTNQKFEELYELILPELLKSWNNWMVINSDRPYTIFLSSTLFETKMNLKMDFNINVFKSKESRRLAMEKSTLMPLSVIDDILDNELSERYKSAKSDFVIYPENRNLEEQITTIHKQILGKETRIYSSTLEYSQMCKNVFI